METPLGGLDPAGLARWDTLTVSHLVERAGLDRSATALVSPLGDRTYGQLRERSRRIAHALVTRGFGELERAAILSTNRPEYVEVELGIAGARGITVPLGWRLSTREIAELLRRAQARVAFVEERFLAEVTAQRLEQLALVVGIPRGGDVGLEDLIAEGRDAPPPRPGRLTDPHEILYTSGTTGEPKGVVWTNGAVLFSNVEQALDYRLGPDSSTYVCIDMHYIGGRHDFTWALLHQGGTVHLRPSGGFDAAEVVRYVAEHRITHELWVPTMLYDILRVPDAHDTSALRMIMCGGAPLSLATIERAEAMFPSTDFIQVYGLTEGGGSVTRMPPSDVHRKVGSAGTASMHNRIRIVDGTGTDVATGVDGEIWVQGPTVTAGYWDDPPRTEEAVVDGWLRTGDLGHLDVDDFLYVTGRAKDLIITGGMNVYPAEVEAVIREHPGVLDVAVVGLPDEKWGERVCAIVVAGEPTPTAEAVIARCRSELAGFKKPSEVHFVDDLPRTSSGKPRKFLLRSQYG